ncbi:MAG: hypothetical protein ABI807_07850 [Sporichthyaceae bacterium]
MRTFGELVSEAESADVTGWGLGWLDGRLSQGPGGRATPASVPSSGNGPAGSPCSWRQAFKAAAVAGTRAEDGAGQHTSET